MSRAAATAGICALVALAATGCIVTDKIDFTDDVNYPPQVIGVAPDNSAILSVCPETTPEFEVSLWDPDEEDAPPQTEAEIRVWLVSDGAGGGEVAGECTVSATTPSAESPYEGGVLLTAACTLEVLAAPVTVPDVLLVRVLVSDRPFVHGVAPETARTAQAFWTLDVLSSVECPER
jgi:hypothetical protein